MKITINRIEEGTVPNYKTKKGDDVIVPMSRNYLAKDVADCIDMAEEQGLDECVLVVDNVGNVGVVIT